MSQKRVLVIGAILLAAGIGAPTTAFLAPGGVMSEPRTPEVQAPAPAPAEPDLDLPTGSPALPTTAATVVPSATSSGPPPNRARRTPPPTRGGPTNRPGLPQGHLLAPTFDDDQRPPPPVYTVQPDPAPPAPSPADDWDRPDQ